MSSASCSLPVRCRASRRTWCSYCRTSASKAAREPACASRISSISGARACMRSCALFAPFIAVVAAMPGKDCTSSLLARPKQPEPQPGKWGSSPHPLPFDLCSGRSRVVRCGKGRGNARFVSKHHGFWGKGGSSGFIGHLPSAAPEFASWRFPVLARCIAGGSSRQNQVPGTRRGLARLRQLPKPGKGIFIPPANDEGTERWPSSSAGPSQRSSF